MFMAESPASLSVDPLAGCSLLYHINWFEREFLIRTYPDLNLIYYLIDAMI